MVSNNFVLTLQNLRLVKKKKINIFRQKVRRQKEQVINDEI